MRITWSQYKYRYGYYLYLCKLLGIFYHEMTKFPAGSKEYMRLPDYVLSVEKRAKAARKKASMMQEWE